MSEKKKTDKTDTNKERNACPWYGIESYLLQNARLPRTWEWKLSGSGDIEKVTSLPWGPARVGGALSVVSLTALEEMGNVNTDI